MRAAGWFTPPEPPAVEDDLRVRLAVNDGQGDNDGRR